MTLTKLLSATAITSTLIMSFSSIAYAQDGGPVLDEIVVTAQKRVESCLLYTSPSPRDATLSRMPSSA